MAKTICIRNVDKIDWLKFQLLARSEGTTASEKIRRYVSETAETDGRTIGSWMRELFPDENTP